MTIQNYVGKDIVAWLYYNKDGGRYSKHNIIQIQDFGAGEPT